MEKSARPVMESLVLKGVSVGAMVNAATTSAGGRTKGPLGGPFPSLHRLGGVFSPG